MDDKLHDLVSRLKLLAKELGKTPTAREFIASGVSWRQIRNHGGHNKLVELAGLNVNYSSHTAEPYELQIRPPKILIFDLEIAPAIAYTYNFREAFISPENIIQMPYILAYSAKWYGESRVYYNDTRNTPKNDLKLLQELSDLIAQADLICGHNLKKFDAPTTRGRMIIQEMMPLKKVEIIDTLKIAYKHFKFPFYKLGELAKYLKCDKSKLDHAKFPGNSLFTEADKGNLKAFKEMEAYCKMDTLVTEEVLTKLMPWEPSINFQTFHQKRICSCGSEEFKKGGFQYNASGIRQRYACIKCGKGFVHKENLLGKDIRKELLK